ncbi:sigma-70 family RNA polymerase sigma factor [Pigmentiphaga sp.]|uniref:RNA polymerase sigma factor n=1 Tax=Pigmentiphaga sp. TaxID=1977564 RepID=UPI0025D18F27|nr:sigma-70 family RNA polymerase sigma factor [Pigmentiphaga sp.]
MSHDASPSVLDYLAKRYASLKLTLTRRLGDADLASDALHDTWVRLQGAGKLPPRDHPGAYLMRVATNIAVDMQRKQRHTVSGEGIDAVLDEMADPGPGPAQRAQACFDLNVVAQLVERMPERRRVIFVMVHWEDMTRQEVADRLNISRRTVETELQRAHERLAAFFHESKK